MTTPAAERFPTIRQSRLASFDRCALSARFDEDYRGDWSGHPQGRGQVFHLFAAEALRAMHAAGERSLPEDVAISILEEVMRQRDVDSMCGVCGGEASFRDGKVRCENGHAHDSRFVNLPLREIRDLRWTAIKFASDNEFDIDNLVDVEQRIRTTVAYPGADGAPVERVITGQLDALFILGDAADHAVVLDWKDTWAMPAPTEVGFEGYFQQRFYALLVLRSYPTVQRVTLREVYPRIRPEDPADPKNVREADVWRSEMDDLVDDISGLVERFDRAFNEDNFPPSPGHHCQMCVLPERCPIFPGVRAGRDGTGQIRSEEEALRFAQEASVAKAALDNRVKALKSWSTHRGAVELSSHKGRRVWGYRERKRVSRPTREEMEAALRVHGAGRVDLNALYKESVTTRFEEHAAAPDDPDPTAEEERLLAALEASVAQRTER